MSQKLVSVVAFYFSVRLSTRFVSFDDYVFGEDSKLLGLLPKYFFSNKL